MLLLGYDHETPISALRAVIGLPASWTLELLQANSCMSLTLQVGNPTFLLVKE